MTAGRRLLGGLLLIVAAAAAVLSFSALRDLAAACGFTPGLAWLLPVVVDAGAAAGSLVWLGGTAARPARQFARGLALTLLALSVAANALGHGLAAYGVRPPWWVVVLVSAVAPAVLGAVVHLAVLVGRQTATVDVQTRGAATEAAVAGPRDPVENADDQAEHKSSPAQPDPALVDGRGLSLRWADAPTADEPGDRDVSERAARLIADGAGRRRLATELGITEWEARQLLARAGADTEAGDRSA